MLRKTLRQLNEIINERRQFHSSFLSVSKKWIKTKIYRLIANTILVFGIVWIIVNFEG